MAYGKNAPFGLRPVSSITGGSWTEKTNEYYIYASDDGVTTYDKNIFTGDPVSLSIDDATGRQGLVIVYDPEFKDAEPSKFSNKPLLGVFQGCEYINDTGKLVQSAYWPAAAKVLSGSLVKAFIIDDPNVVYDIQISVHRDAMDYNGTIDFGAWPSLPVRNAGDGKFWGSTASNFALNVGGGTNFNTITAAEAPKGGYPNNPSSGSTRTGQSAFYLEASTAKKYDAGQEDYYKNVATLPLKVIGYSLNPNNVPAPGQTMGFTPFLNVRVIINNHYYRVGNVGATKTE